MGDKVPFVPSGKLAIQKILEHKIIPRASIIYDLGCGDAKVLACLIKKIPGVKGVGVEKDPIVFPLAWIRKLFLLNRSKDLKLILGDIRNVDISKADVLYVFLMPEFMKQIIIPKIEKELKPGVLVISNMFEIPKTKNLRLYKKLLLKEYRFPTRHNEYLWIYRVVK
ncbi:hypothetical protein JW962_02040 [Candidatus Dojkabacteria bacterium]|nr:hypothetical protein [Candidatus Dojkabacteria bacterium]